MKIKLGSFITEAKGVIGGTYVGQQRGTKYIARKRSRSGQAQAVRSDKTRLIRFLINKWKTLTATQQGTWSTAYGNKLKGFRQYVIQNSYRQIPSASFQTSVNIASKTSAVSLLSFAYTQLTGVITVTLERTDTGGKRRTIQIRNYSNRRSVVGHSGWINLLSFDGNIITPINISDSIKGRGLQVTNNTTFQLRIVQIPASTAPIKLSAVYTIKTGR